MGAVADGLAWPGEVVEVLRRRPGVAEEAETVHAGIVAMAIAASVVEMAPDHIPDEIDMTDTPGIMMSELTV